MGLNLRLFISGLPARLFTFYTPKVVAIRDLKIGILFRVIQISIVLYIIGYVIIWQKGYQFEETGHTSTTVKLKGMSFTSSEHAELQERLWDPPEYVIPAQMSNAFFIMTNVIVTPKQMLSECAESLDVSSCSPTQNNCSFGRMLFKGNGMQTGRCVAHSNSSQRYSCQIKGWCPLENDTLPAEPVLKEAENFTIMLKNFVGFTFYKVRRRNLIENITLQYLKSCVYHHITHPYCPIFRIGDIVKYVNSDFLNLAKLGGVIRILIRWRCNLDDAVSNCLPEYEFFRLDFDDADVSPGWNFRFARHYRQNDVEYRDLYKAYGILFVISADAKARKFSFMDLVLKIGSGIGLISLATITCDLIMLYVHRQREYYRENKFYTVNRIKSANKAAAGGREDGTGEEKLEESAYHFDSPPV